MGQKIKCPCCGFFTLAEDDHSLYEICPVCRWEADPVQLGDIDFEGGANKESLNVARKNFKKFGAKSKEDACRVRKPFSDEIPF